MVNIFQSDEYFSFLCKTGLFDSFRFTVKREGDVVGSMLGYIQQDGGALERFLSRRAIINAGPFLSEDISNDELTTLLRDCINGLKSKVIYIETRNYKDYSAYREIFEKVGFSYEPHYDFIVDTRDVETVDSKMETSRKRFVKASLKNGASIVENPTLEDVTEFYGVLRELYQNKIKTPLFPLQFFEKLYQTSFSKYILVRYADEIVGGMVCVYDDETVYEWFVCGKDGVYKNVSPSIMATYYAIRFAAENGFKHFDMMGAGAPGDGGYGVREFKAKFGGKLVEYGRFKYISHKPLYALGKIGVSLMKKIDIR